MQLVTWAEAVSINFRKSAGISTMTFEAGREYVMARQQFGRIIQEQGVQQRCFKTSQIENRIPNFHVMARKPGSQRLLLYNGSGGYGDQIMTWPLARILTSYGFEVHVLVDPGNQTCWWNFPYIKSVVTLPIQHEHFKLFDYWAMFEAVANTDEHQSQLHPLDIMLHKIGIEPESVDAKMKVVRPNFTFLEMQSTLAFQGRSLAMYQLASANPIRCLPPTDSAFLLLKLADAFPDLLWLALHDEFIPEGYAKALICPQCGAQGRVKAGSPPVTVGTTGTCAPVPVGLGTNPDILMAEAVAKMAEVEKARPSPQAICPSCKGSGTLRPNVQLHCAPVLRELWALATQAKVVVAPDSMMVHVAGCMDIPCVGLWGLCNPSNRVKYYKNHVPVWKRDACPFSPCFAYSGVFPKYCPPRPNRQVCECLGAIAPTEAIAAVTQALSLRAAK